MIHSNKSNLALRRGRDHLFDRGASYRKPKKEKIRKVLPASPAVRREFQAKLRRELRQEKFLAVGLVVGISILVFVAYYLRYVN
ncbi:MAG: hypothetical protein AAGF89_11730 [Bacteroidota bacterium]